MNFNSNSILAFSHWFTPASGVLYFKSLSKNPTVNFFFQDHEFYTWFCDWKLSQLPDILAKRLLGPSSFVETPGLVSCSGIQCSHVHFGGRKFSHGLCLYQVRNFFITAENYQKLLVSFKNCLKCKSNPILRLKKSYNKHQDVVPVRNLIKWSTPLPLKDTVQTQQIRDSKMERKSCKDKNTLKNHKIKSIHFCQSRMSDRILTV